MSAPITEELLFEAIDRLARTPDGRLLYLFCQRRMMALSTSDVRGALRQDHGERRFAAKLISLMAKGISESGGRTGHSGDTSGTSSGDEPIVFAVPKPVAVGGSRGAGRRIGPDTRVPGWDRDEA